MSQQSKTYIHDLIVNYHPEERVIEQLDNHLDCLSYVEPVKGANCAMMALYFSHFKLFEKILDIYEKDSSLFDINHMNHFKKSLFHLVINHESQEPLEILVKFQQKTSSINLNLKSKSGKTFLHLLLEHINKHSLDRLKLILTMDGINVNAQDDLLQSPIHYLVNSNSRYATDDAYRFKVLKYLIDYQKTPSHQYDFDFAIKDELNLNAFMGICLRDNQFKKMVDLALKHFELFDIYSLGKDGHKMNVMELAASEDKKINYLLNQSAFQNIGYLEAVKSCLPLKYQQKISLHVANCEKEKLNAIILEPHDEKNLNKNKIKL